MSRLCVIILVSVLMFGISGCSFVSMSRAGRSEKELANDRIEKLVSAIEQKDKAAICSMFSPNVQESSPELDSDIIKLINMYEGQMTDYEPYLSTSEGPDSKKITAQYSVITDKNIYEFYFVDIIKSKGNKRDEGLYMLQVTERSKIPDGFKWDKDSPGIRFPLSESE